jgi:hypothetical protein
MGPVTHWNAFVANLEMHGKGTFYDPRLNDPIQFPISGASRIRQCSKRSGFDHLETSGSSFLSTRDTGASGRMRKRAGDG